MAESRKLWTDDVNSHKASQGEVHSEYISIQYCFDAILQFINQFVYFVYVYSIALMNDGNEAHKRKQLRTVTWVESIQLNVSLFCQQFDRLFEDEWPQSWLI